MGRADIDAAIAAAESRLRANETVLGRERRFRAVVQAFDGLADAPVGEADAILSRLGLVRKSDLSDLGRGIDLRFGELAITLRETVAAVPPAEPAKAPAATPAIQDRPESAEPPAPMAGGRGGRRRLPRRGRMPTSGDGTVSELPLPVPSAPEAPGQGLRAAPDSHRASQAGEPFETLAELPQQSEDAGASAIPVPAAPVAPAPGRAEPGLAAFDSLARLAPAPETDALSPGWERPAASGVPPSRVSPPIRPGIEPPPGDARKAEDYDTLVPATIRHILRRSDAEFLSFKELDDDTEITQAFVQVRTNMREKKQALRHVLDRDGLGWGREERGYHLMEGSR